MDTGWTETTAGCVITKDGPVPFDEWYLTRFGEEPSSENIRRRVAAAKGEDRDVPTAD